jgi:hypothetical protein
MNALLNPLGIVAEFNAADDESVDDEVALYVDGHQAAGVQISDGTFTSYCLSKTKADTMTFGKERQRLSPAVADAYNLLKAEGWVK